MKTSSDLPPHLIVISGKRKEGALPPNVRQRGRSDEKTLPSSSFTYGDRRASPKRLFSSLFLPARRGSGWAGGGLTGMSVGRSTTGEGG